uniref:EF-hand domain-containing protein n=1 Tax=Strigamia maritima TaxID=126957 RepID=T1JFX7_STRMM
MFPNSGPPGQQQPIHYPNQSYGDARSQQTVHQPGYNPTWDSGSNSDSEVMLWFQAVDVDGSGRISAIELRQALTNANWSLFSEETCRLMIGLFDRDQNKSIDIQEFQQLWRYIQQWHQTFSRVDQNNSGYIEQVELQQAMASMGYNLSTPFIQILIARFDYLRQNKLTLDAFIMACVILQQLTETFKQKDVERRAEIRVNYDDFLQMALSGIP